MDYIGDIFYNYGTELYANITNICPCRCNFCIRDIVSGLGTAENLWLKREPTLKELKELARDVDFDAFDELVFCGYGEPTERLDDLLSLVKFIKEDLGFDIRIRINTNGLGNLIHGRDTTKDLVGLVDAVSVSLNASSPEKYVNLCNPSFGLKAWDCILEYAELAKSKNIEVTMSVVGGTISREDEEICRKIAEDRVKVKFRVR